MATREQIRSVLIDEQFTPGEKFIVRMQFAQAIQPSNFESKLWEVICAADQDNLDRLECAFPAEVRAFRSWTQGDLGNRVRKAGCPI